MSDPQLPPPPPGPAAPPAYSPPAGAYTAGPAGYQDAYGPYVPAPQSGKPSSILGILALVIALVSLVVSSALGTIAGFEIGRVLGELDPQLTGVNTADLSFLAPAREQVLLAEIGFWVGTVLGIWALVQGIIAIVRRRGRGAGIGAVVVSVLAPGVYFGLLTLAFSFGIAAGALGQSGF